MVFYGAIVKSLVFEHLYVSIFNNDTQIYVGGINATPYSFWLQ
jgi:hypothetical protein